MRQLFAYLTRELVARAKQQHGSIVFFALFGIASSLILNETGRLGDWSKNMVSSVCSTNTLWSTMLVSSGILALAFLVAAMNDVAAKRTPEIRLLEIAENGLNRGRVRIKMRTVVAYATLAHPPPWCALWRTPYEIGNNLTVKHPFHMGLRSIYAESRLHA